MPNDDQAACDYQAGCALTRRHVHPYELRGWGSRRCTCGNRHWRISLGQLAAPEVQCDRCAKRNYSATAYEAGRRDGLQAAAKAAPALQGPAPKIPF